MCMPSSLIFKNNNYCILQMVTFKLEQKILQSNMHNLSKQFLQQYCIHIIHYDV